MEVKMKIINVFVDISDHLSIKVFFSNKKNLNCLDLSQVEYVKKTSDW